MAYSSAKIWLYDKCLVTGVAAADILHKESALLLCYYWKLRFYLCAKGNLCRTTVRISNFKGKLEKLQILAELCDKQLLVSTELVT